MRNALVVFLVLAMAAPAARADSDQDKWRAAFAGSVMITATGTTMMLWGRNRIDTAEHALCTGDYATGCGHPAPTTSAEVDEYNDKGARGQTIGRVGFGVLVTGLVLTGITGYKGFAGGKKEQSVAVAPSIGPHGAGASLTLRW
ncbi:MAG TPA: hypothetical protein VMZ53_00355 [Kofleriaceae bacterium]|nr:hypothetical protein [Kofleriaceae bacterium]